MKKTLSISILAMAISTSVQAAPVNGMVKFTGTIEAGTCVVATGSKDLPVTLPPVINQQFGGPSTTLGDTDFTLNFTGCATTSNGSHSLAVHFSGPTVAGHKDVLVASRDSGPGASDVGIEVVQGNQKLNMADGVGIDDLVLSADAHGDASLKLTAKYIQLGASLPAAGKLAASMNYTVIYK